MSSTDEEEEKPAVIIDNGSFDIKACLTGDKPIPLRFRSIVGRPKGKLIFDERNYICGDEAEIKTIILNKRYPIKKGIIHHWDDVEALWKHTFHELNLFRNDKKTTTEIESYEQPLMLTEPPLNPKGNREKTTQIVFESLNVPAFYLMNICCAALYSYGRTNGVVVDSGYEITHCLPIYEGYSLPHALTTIDIGGYHINQLLLQKLKEKKNYVEKFGSNSMINNISFAEYEIIESIKKNLCFIHLNDEKEEKESEYKYELPDGQSICLNEERFQCADILFNPLLLGQYNVNDKGEIMKNGIDIKVDEAITKCDKDIRKDMYENITVVGGNTMFKGFVEKLQQKMEYLVGDKNDIETKVIAVDDRRYSVVIGCSIVGSLSTWQDQWIKAEEYDETGPPIVHRKCT
eukprot:351630_1